MDHSITADCEAARQRLVELEAQMRSLDPLDDAYWRLKPERTRLREAIDVLWLDSHRFGTRIERWAPLPWPDDVRGRWRVVREFVEAYDGVALGDVVGVSYASERLSRLGDGAIGESVRQWTALVDELIAAGLWGRVFRDVPSLRPVPDVGGYFSLMIQGEADYHWAIRAEGLGEDDPPVFAFRLDYERSRFVPERAEPSYGPYGSYASVTDFVRSMLDSYLHGPLGAPLHRLSAVRPEMHFSSDRTRGYGESLAGVWSAPLAPRVAFPRGIVRSSARSRPPR